MHRFEIVDMQVYRYLETWVRGHSRSPKLSATYGFLLTFDNNHGPISYRFWDKRWFQSIIALYSHLRVFCSPALGASLGVR